MSWSRPDTYAWLYWHDSSSDSYRTKLLWFLKWEAPETFYQQVLKEIERQKPKRKREE